MLSVAQLMPPKPSSVFMAGLLEFSLGLEEAKLSEGEI